jgi:hypothetical protein
MAKGTLLALLLAKVVYTAAGRTASRTNQRSSVRHVPLGLALPTILRYNTYVMRPAIVRPAAWPWERPSGHSAQARGHQLAQHTKPNEPEGSLKINGLAFSGSSRTAGQRDQVEPDAALGAGYRHVSAALSAMAPAGCRARHRASARRTAARPRSHTRPGRRSPPWRRPRSSSGDRSLRGHGCSRCAAR